MNTPIRPRSRLHRKKKWHESTYINLLFLPIFFLFLLGVKDLNQAMSKPTHAQLISPLATEQAAKHSHTLNYKVLLFPTPTPTAMPTPTPVPKFDDPTQKAIRKEIHNVFGEYAPKALLLLSCENPSLNPTATNVNNDEWNSTDWGVFQINDHWQKIYNPAFLTDYTINIRIAYNIFVRDNYSFKLWTCGRRLGI